MKKILSTCIAMAAGTLLMTSALAQMSETPATGSAGSGTSGSMQTMPQSQTTPTQTTAPSTMSHSSHSGMSNARSADLTGQTIYSTKGHKLGTVVSMTTDSHGQQAALVTMGRNLGMGGKEVAIPVSSLQKRSKGGYETTLTATELKNLPATQGGGTQ